MKTLPKESQEALFQLILLATHQEVGHLGLEQMLNLMCDHFFWPHMATQVREHIKKCHQCVTFKVKQQRIPMENIVTTHPLELLHLDYLYLEPGKHNKENVLVVMDHFNCYAKCMSPDPRWS